MELNKEELSTLVDYLDSHLELSGKEKNVVNDIQEDIDILLDRRAYLIEIETKKILQNTKFSNDEKKEKIDDLEQKPFKELEQEIKEKSEHLENLENSFARGIVSDFVKSTNINNVELKDGDIDAFYEDFTDKKLDKLADNHIKNSNLYKDYMTSLSKHKIEFNPSPYWVMRGIDKILDKAINVSSDLMEGNFKNHLKAQLINNVSDNKSLIKETIIKSCKSKQLNKKLENER